MFTIGVIVGLVLGTIFHMVSFFNTPEDFSQFITPSNRAERFPSVEERVKLYMGDWYAPPCKNSNASVEFHYKGSTRLDLHLASENKVVEIFNEIEADRVFFLDTKTLAECVNETSIPFIEKGEQNDKDAFKKKKKALIRKNMRLYCLDALTSLVPSQQRDFFYGTKYPPILLQFGDLQHSHAYGLLNVPYFKKYRLAARNENLAEATQDDCLSKRRGITGDPSHLQPIVWKLSVSRHYRSLPLVAESDTEWSLKKPMAIFRGQLTGSLHSYDRQRTDEENCLQWTRCRLVYKHSNSTLVDAKLTSTRKRMPNTLNGVNLIGDSVPLSGMMQYKGIVMMEGNDVSSGLKWALLSQSVVLMSPPTYTSWAMEELLVPWVHYIPLNEGATDVEEKMRWVVDNDEKAKRIAERGTQWIQDLCFHPDSAAEEKLIQQKMIQRYFAHFRPAEML